MLITGLLLQVAVAQSAAVSAESLYTSPALRTTVQRAAVANGLVPPTLAKYQAHLETEMALIIVDTLGRERTGQIEQLGGTARWAPDSGFHAHVEGYRMQTTGVPMSM